MGRSVKTSHGVSQVKKNDTSSNQCSCQLRRKLVENSNSRLDRMHVKPSIDQGADLDLVISIFKF